MSRLYLIAITAIFVSYIGYKYHIFNITFIKWITHLGLLDISNKIFIVICLEYKNNSSSTYIIYTPKASTSTKTHNRYQYVVFYKKWVFGICIKVPWYFCNMPLEVCSIITYMYSDGKL